MLGEATFADTCRIIKGKKRARSQFDSLLMLTREDPRAYTVVSNLYSGLKSSSEGVNRGPLAVSGKTFVFSYRVPQAKNRERF